MLGLRKVDGGTRDVRWINSWMEFYPGFRKWNVRYLPSNGLNWKLDFSFIWGQFYLEFKTNKQPKYKDERPTYGFYFYSVGSWFPDSLWIYRGTKKIKCIDLPWQYDWIRTSKYLKDGTWVHQTKKNRIDLFNKEYEEKTYYETHKYYYIHDDLFQETEAVCHIEEREWRPKWFKWLPLFKKVRRDIDVEFKTPIGRGVDSYKGGTYGSSHLMMSNETIKETLKRMMKERKF
jgi:hypothetical protein